MNTQSEDAVSVLDIVKQVLSIVAVLAGIWAFDHFADIQLIYRLLALIVVIGIAVVTFFTTAKGRSVWGFFQEAKQEAKRVVWPTRDEAFRTTALVVAMVVIVGLLLWVIDYTLYAVINSLMGLGES